MHEYSMAKGLVEAVMGEVAAMRPRPRRVLRVRVSVGELRQVVPEFFRDAFRRLAQDTVAAGSELVLETVPLRARCRECGWEGRIRPDEFRCGGCGSWDIELTAGMELALTGLRVEFDEEESGEPD